MYPAKFEYHAPTTLAEVLSLLQQHPEGRMLAGGHSLLPMMKLRLAQPEHLIGLRRIKELHGFRDEPDVLTIGAMTCHRDVAFSEEVRHFLPLLAELAGVIADPQVRNRGTIGGSVAHADPAADYPAGLLALEARMNCLSARGERSISAEEFFLDMFSTALAHDEILTGVSVPKISPGTGFSYVKLRHPASRFAAAGVACTLRFAGKKPAKVRLALTGVANRAVVCAGLQQEIRELSFDERGEPEAPPLLRAACLSVCSGVEVEDILNYRAEHRINLSVAAAERAIRAAAKRAREARSTRRV